MYVLTNLFHTCQLKATECICKPGIIPISILWEFCVLPGGVAQAVEEEADLSFGSFTVTRI